jgi:hypothetical protein
VTANTIQGSRIPWPARKAPSATTVSAGTGGKMFSTAARRPIEQYSGTAGSVASD